MKLYTEEQLREAARGEGWTENVNEIVDRLTPIELPSDEDIEKKSYKLFHQNDNIGKGTWIYGAKWMKSKILGNNHLGGITY